MIKKDDLIFLHNGGPIYDDKTDGDQLPGWYFWDEASYYHGPFGTREEASAAYSCYFKMM